MQDYCPIELSWLVAQASIYNNFHTTHSLFEIHVIADLEDFDQENDLDCQMVNFHNVQNY
jgi:hypothetical protein